MVDPEDTKLGQNKVDTCQLKLSIHFFDNFVGVAITIRPFWSAVANSTFIRTHLKLPCSLRFKAQNAVLRGHVSPAVAREARAFIVTLVNE